MALSKPGRRPYPQEEMNIRILIIDEHSRSREMLARRLASLPGLEVVGASCDGERGLRQIEELQPDVVLLDSKMKRVDGMDICRRACANANGGKIAILTSYIDPEERRLAYQAGVSGYHLKNVDTPSLARWIASLVEGGGPRPGKSEATPTHRGTQLAKSTIYQNSADQGHREGKISVVPVAGAMRVRNGERCDRVL